MKKIFREALKPDWFQWFLCKYKLSLSTNKGIPELRFFVVIKTK
jgi:hypothetical protein